MSDSESSDHESSDEYDEESSGDEGEDEGRWHRLFFFFDQDFLIFFSPFVLLPFLISIDQR